MYQEVYIIGCQPTLPGARWFHRCGGNTQKNSGAMENNPIFISFLAIIHLVGPDQKGFGGPKVNNENELKI